MKISLAAPMALGCLLFAGVSSASNSQTILPYSGPKTNLPVPEPSALPKPQSAGQFVDGAGHSHPWQITANHSLNWDGTPYLPAGVQFVPASWQPNAGDNAWASDQKAIAALHSHGISDVCLSAGSAELTAVPAARVQRVLDCLDGLGMRYGIEISGYPKSPLTGYLVKPGAFRNPSPASTGSTRFGHISGLLGGIYMLVSPSDNSIDESGKAKVIDGATAEIAMNKPQPDDILVLYPEVTLSDRTPESHLPDLWDGFDDYRDTVIGLFHDIKFGPGFRFFLDPLTNGLAINGSVDNLIPDTDGFRLDFQAWLENHYQHNIDDLNRSWGIDVQEQILPDFATAARCFPLWSGKVGVPAVFDPRKSQTYPVMNSPRLYSRYWSDLNDFRQTSVRGYMNAMAQALKLGVADVPVVYRWTQQNGIFANDETKAGYDGLAISSETGASDLDSSAYAYAQSEDCAKTTWLIAADLPLAGSAMGTPSAQQATRQDLLTEWDSLREVGTRGYFTKSPADGALPAQSDLAAISAYADSLAAMAPSLSDSAPSILWYPAGIGVDVGVKRLSEGVWWLPTYRPGELLTLGSSLEGYGTIDDHAQHIYVIWSRVGTVVRHEFTFGKTERPVVTDAAGLPVKYQAKGSVYTLDIGPEPLIISNVFTVPLPAEAAAESIKQARDLMQLADFEKVNVDREKDEFFYTITNVRNTPENQELLFDSSQLVIGGLLNALQPFIWLEGEAASPNNFNTEIADPEASHGAYLSLDTDSDPPNGDQDTPAGYYATYAFTVGAAGRYSLWVAGSPVNTAQSSPYTFTFDDDVPRDLTGAVASGQVYDSRFVWTELGDVSLSAGSHKLVISVTGPRQSDNRYRLDLDALCLSRVPFTPDGVKQPVIGTWLPQALAAAQSAAPASKSSGKRDPGKSGFGLP